MNIPSQQRLTRKAYSDRGTPWVGRCDEHRPMGGFRIPTRGEVAWVVDGQEEVYWRGRVLSAEFGLGA